MSDLPVKLSIEDAKAMFAEEMMNDDILAVSTWVPPSLREPTIPPAEFNRLYAEAIYEKAGRNADYLLENIDSILSDSNESLFKTY